MKFKNLLLGAIVVSTALVSCKKKDKPKEAMDQTFKVTIENVSEPRMFFKSGVFNTPVGASQPGAATPGNAYEFTFHAGPGHMLSFETMYGQSNDLFFAPGGDGIALFNNNNQPISGDVTAQIMLWDAGTEVNEMPGSGSNQAPRQPAPNTGPDENGTVRTIDNVNDGFTYPSVSSTIKVSISNNGGTEFTVRIENLPGSPTPIAPGVWVVHTDPNPLFTENQPDNGYGLEAAAEDGNPTMLSSYLADNSGLVTPLAPGVWVVQNGASKPLFMEDEPDYGEGLEALAEDGNPAPLSQSLMSKAMVESFDVFNSPVGSSEAGPLFPGSKYEFEINASKGDYLNFATMFVQSNDLFYAAKSDEGIALWNGKMPISGDITNMVALWDAGTEVNEYPGTGLNQAPRQSGPDSGPDENGNVMIVDDGFSYPAVSDVIKVTITPKN